MNAHDTIRAALDAEARADAARPAPWDEIVRRGTRHRRVARTARLAAAAGLVAVVAGTVVVAGGPEQAHPPTSPDPSPSPSRLVDLDVEVARLSPDGRTLYVAFSECAVGPPSLQVAEDAATVRLRLEYPPRGGSPGRCSPPVRAHVLEAHLARPLGDRDLQLGNGKPVRVVESSRLLTATYLPPGVEPVRHEDTAVTRSGPEGWTFVWVGGAAVELNASPTEVLVASAACPQRSERRLRGTTVVVCRHGYAVRAFWRERGWHYHLSLSTPGTPDEAELVRVLVGLRPVT